MSKGIITILSLVFLFVFQLSSSFSALSQEGEMKKMDNMQSVTGTVFCVEVDEQGTVNITDQFDVCTGTLMVMGADGKTYALKGTAEETKMMMKQPGKTKTVSGIISGHTRGWVLASASAEQPASSENVTVTGTIVCLLPNYSAGNFKQVVSTGPCSEAEPHLHVVKTASGQVYALEGTEESISKIESMSNRENVQLQGKIQGEQGAWVLFVQ
jgi:hypothetical protein